MKLLFNTQNKTVELQNSNNEMVDFWKVENEKVFLFTKNSIVDYIAAYIIYAETEDFFFCNGKRMRTNDVYEICNDNEFKKFFMVDGAIINDYDMLKNKEVNQ